jgi:3-dehydroquinate dehydratase/shikimate dehydrogenase
MAELRRNRDAALGADLVELRLDSVADPDVAGALQGRTRPVILTCRSAAEGGWFEGSEEERRAILGAAVASDAEYVDLEWRKGLTDLVARRRGRGIVCSTHDFAAIPRDLVERADATGAEVVKIAVPVTCLADNITLLDVSRHLHGRRRVVIGMGEAGAVTRVCAARFGSAWSYAGLGVAPGQLSLVEMAREFTFARVGADTALYGLVGRPVSHSVSPAMHNAGFAELSVDAVYVPMPAADIDDLLAFAAAFRPAGASVTAPFKLATIGVADDLDETAREIGAVNTLAWRDGRILGTNTDAAGFLEPLAGVPLDGVRVAVLGAGGAARAVALAMTRANGSVTLYGRNPARARDAAQDTGARAAGRPVPRGSWDVLVNATPAGTQPNVDESAYPEGGFEGRLVYDLVYNPPVTRLMRDAAAAGCRVIGGLDMLVSQARLQQLCWTGRAPDPGVLRRAAEWKLSTWAGDA